MSLERMPECYRGYERSGNHQDREEGHLPGYTVQIKKNRLCYYQQAASFFRTIKIDVLATAGELIESVKQPSGILTVSPDSLYIRVSYSKEEMMCLSDFGQKLIMLETSIAPGISPLNKELTGREPGLIRRI